MSEWIERELVYLPKYIENFGSLLAGPKRFIAREISNADETLAQSLRFLGISLVLFTVMQTPTRPSEYEFWTHLGLIGITCLAVVSLTAIALRFSWWVVGGRATIRIFFVTYSYLLAVVLVLSGFSRLLSLGFLKVFDPDLYAQLQLLKGQQLVQSLGDALSEGVTLWVTIIIFAVGLLCCSVWSFLCWGAYRELNDLSKFRSFFAFMIMGILSLVIVPAVHFIESAIVP